MTDGEKDIDGGELSVGEDGRREVGEDDEDGTAISVGAVVGRDGVRDCAGDMEGHKDDGRAERNVVGQ